MKPSNVGGGKGPYLENALIKIRSEPLVTETGNVEDTIKETTMSEYQMSDKLTDLRKKLYRKAKQDQLPVHA